MQGFLGTKDFLIFHSADIGMSLVQNRLSSNRFAGVKD